MNKYLLRKEYFGGLLFNRSDHSIKVIVPNEYAELKEKINDYDLVENTNCNFATLSAPIKVFLVLTNKCNLNCKFCLNDSSINNNTELKFNDIKILLTQIKRMGVFEIGITGGEPLCHPDFFNIVKLIKAEGFPVSLNTSGVFNRKHLDLLANMGIKEIKISIDGLEETNDRIRGKNTFKKIIDTIIFLKERNNDVRLNFTVLKENQNELFDVIKLANSLGCDIKIAPLHAVGRALIRKDALLCDDERKEIYNRIIHFRRNENIKIAVGVIADFIEENCLKISKNSNYQFSLCGNCRVFASIDNDGKLYNTGRQTDFKKVGSVGNIKDELFSELWEKVIIKNEAMKMKHEKCMKCNIDLLLFNSFKRQ